MCSHVIVSNVVQWFLGKAETNHLEMLIVFIGLLLSTIGAELLQASREHKSFMKMILLKFGREAILKPLKIGDMLG